MGRTTFTGGLLDGASNGLGRLAQSLAFGKQAYNASFDQESQLQSRLAQALAAQQRAQAEVSKADEETRGLRIKNERLTQLPGMADEQAAISSGASVPQIQAFRDSLRTGAKPILPGVQLDGPNLDGTAGVQALMPPELSTRIGQALQRSLPVALSNGDINPAQWAQAAETYRNIDLGDAVLNGQRDAGAVGKAQAAVKGSDLFKGAGDGTVLDIFGGGLDTSSPLARAAIGLKGAQAGQANAAATASRASADKSTAEAAQVRAGKPNLQVVTTDNGNVMIVDKNTGRAMPATGPDGQPIQGKGGSLNGEQANALAFATRMQAANKVLENLAALGVDQRGKLKQAVGDLPFAGAIANAAQSDEQQQVEQAQRDFINAILRRESGAAIGQNEFENAARQYFPQPYDKPGALKQKAEARLRAVQTMLAAVPENQRKLPGLPVPASSPASPASGNGWSIQKVN